jgi:hypothetical protein
MFTSMQSRKRMRTKKHLHIQQQFTLHWLFLPVCALACLYSARDLTWVQVRVIADYVIGCWIETLTGGATYDQEHQDDGQRKQSDLPHGCTTHTYKHMQIKVRDQTLAFAPLWPSHVRLRRFLRTHHETKYMQTCAPTGRPRPIL